MIKIHNIHIGSKDDLRQINDSWAVVHACKTSHQQRLGYTSPIKGSPYYIEFRDGDHLYINWVDEPTGKYFQIETFNHALDFIDEYLKDRDVFIHCDMGQSRSPTLGMVYLAKRTDYLDDNFDSAVSKFTSEYPYYEPSGILKFVQANWNEIK